MHPCSRLDSFRNSMLTISAVKMRAIAKWRSLKWCAAREEKRAVAKWIELNAEFKGEYMESWKPQIIPGYAPNKTGVWPAESPLTPRYFFVQPPGFFRSHPGFFWGILLRIVEHLFFLDRGYSGLPSFLLALIPAKSDQIEHEHNTIITPNQYHQ